MASSDIKYPPDVAAEFFSREHQSRRAIEEWAGRSSEDSRTLPAESPTQLILTQLVETMLFASMATEEGHLTPAGIVFAESIAPFEAIAPAWDFIRFDESWRFEVSLIAKLASACSSPESLLAVVPQNETLTLVGIVAPHSRDFLNRDRLVRVLILKPGVISVRRGEWEVVRYERGKLHPRPPPLLGVGQHRAQLDSMRQTVFQGELQLLKFNVEDFLLQIVQGMVRLGHGGLLVVLGPEDEPGLLLKDAKVLAKPLQFGDALRDMYEAQLADHWNTQNQYSPETGHFRPPTEEEERDADDARKKASQVTRLAEQIARLTTVDGAVVMSHALAVLAFGVKLSSKEEAPTVYSVTNDRGPGELWPLATRGTRHRAAAIFAAQHPEGLAFIVSQDGDAAILQKLGSEIVYWPLPL